MAIVRTKYESNAVGIIFCEMSEEEAAVAGTVPAADAVAQLTAYVSGSRRRNGVHVRGMVLKREITDGTDTVSISKFVALRSAANLTAPTYQPGSTVMIDGVDWEVSKLREETVV